MWRPFLGPMERMKNTAKPPVNDHPKFKGLVVAYGRVIAYGKRNTRGIFLEEDRAQFKRIAHAVSKSWYVYFHVVTKITPYSLCSVICTASIEIKLCLYVFAYKAIKTIETSEAVIQKVAAVV